MAELIPGQAMKSEIYTKARQTQTYIVPHDTLQKNCLLPKILIRKIYGFSITIKHFRTSYDVLFDKGCYRISNQNRVPKTSSNTSSAWKFTPCGTW